MFDLLSSEGEKAAAKWIGDEAELGLYRSAVEHRLKTYPKTMGDWFSGVVEPTVRSDFFSVRGLGTGPCHLDVSPTAAGQPTLESARLWLHQVLRVSRVEVIMEQYIEPVSYYGQMWTMFGMMFLARYRDDFVAVMEKHDVSKDVAKVLWQMYLYDHCGSVTNYKDLFKGFGDVTASDWFDAKLAAAVARCEVETDGSTVEQVVVSYGGYEVTLEGDFETGEGLSLKSVYDDDFSDDEFDADHPASEVSFSDCVASGPYISDFDTVVLPITDGYVGAIDPGVESSGKMHLSVEGTYRCLDGDISEGGPVVCISSVPDGVLEVYARRRFGENLDPPIPGILDMMVTRGCHLSVIIDVGKVGQKSRLVRVWVYDFDFFSERPFLMADGGGGDFEFDNDVCGVYDIVEPPGSEDIEKLCTDVVSLSCKLMASLVTSVALDVTFFASGETRVVTRTTLSELSCSTIDVFLDLLVRRSSGRPLALSFAGVAPGDLKLCVRHPAVCASVLAKNFMLFHVRDPVESLHSVLGLLVHHDRMSYSVMEAMVRRWFLTSEVRELLKFSFTVNSLTPGSGHLISKPSVIRFAAICSLDEIDLLDSTMYIVVCTQNEAVLVRDYVVSSGRSTEWANIHIGTVSGFLGRRFDRGVFVRFKRGGVDDGWVLSSGKIVLSMFQEELVVVSLDHKQDRVVDLCRALGARLTRCKHYSVVGK